MSVSIRPTAPPVAPSADERSAWDRTPPPRRAGRVAARTAGLPAPARRLLGSRLLEALAAPHGMSRFLELINPLWSLEESRAVVTATRRETADTRTLTLRPTRSTASRCVAGQYVRVGVEVDGVRTTRCFSVSSSQHRADGQFQITVKAHADGRVSRLINEWARPGLVVTVSEPEGEFVLPTPRPERLLFICGGSGITPIMAMLRTLRDEGHRGRITVLNYVRGRADVIFGDELADLAARDGVEVTTVFTREDDAAGRDGAGGPPLTGHLGREHLDRVAPDHTAATTYVCGPAGLIDSAGALWAEDDAEDRLHVERFHPPAFELPEDEATGTVRFTRSRIQVPSDGRPLLDQAEAAGLSPEHGCRMGICRSCTRPKTAGLVRNVITGELSREPEEDIQICISAPAGDVDVDL
jgi:stearoyl-CoA 9-desaturase NADPH oxidoreductase